MPVSIAAKTRTSQALSSHVLHDETSRRPITFVLHTLEPQGPLFPKTKKASPTSWVGTLPRYSRAPVLKFLGHWPPKIGEPWLAILC